MIGGDATLAPIAPFSVGGGGTITTPGGNAGLFNAPLGLPLPCRTKSVTNVEEVKPELCLKVFVICANACGACPRRIYPFSLRNCRILLAHRGPIERRKVPVHIRRGSARLSCSTNLSRA